MDETQALAGQMKDDGYVSDTIFFLHVEEEQKVFVLT
jgi:hypothetical protein